MSDMNDRMKILECKLTKNNSLIPSAGIFFAEAAHCLGLGDQRTKLLCFLIESTLELRMKELDADNPELTVMLERRERDLAISIADKGVPYVPTANQKKILQRGLADSFHFEQLGAEGQRITFFIGLPMLAASALSDTMHVVGIDAEGIWHLPGEADDPHREPLLDREVRCRLTTTSDEDIIEVIRCIYAAWKYTYVHDNMYYLDYFREVIGNGSYISVLAENAHGQVLGHTAFKENAWFLGLMEACGLIVKPFARHMHVAELMHEAVYGASVEKGLEGFYALVATMHPISQQILERNGAVPCGMILHMCAADKVDVVEGDVRRRDAAIAANIMNRARRHDIYLPDACEDFVRQVYEKMGLSFRIMTEPVDIRPGTEAADIQASVGAAARISYQRDISNQSLDILIDSADAAHMRDLTWVRA